MSRQQKLKEMTFGRPGHARNNASKCNATSILKIIGCICVAGLIAYGGQQSMKFYHSQTTRGLLGGKEGDTESTPSKDIDKNIVLKQLMPHPIPIKNLDPELIRELFASRGLSVDDAYQFIEYAS